ncbi:hypothetical protein [Nostoc sp. LEGE 06077]|uniref:hypothetical protein n=1 Tax=Nostoc sp. LEGE 06077 TaxID=915325 RepID=UPI001D1482FB|nr:hypothetical protein [Nostoc sp. LEGE 06077]
MKTSSNSITCVYNVAHTTIVKVKVTTAYAKHGNVRTEALTTRTEVTTAYAKHGNVRTEVTTAYAKHGNVRTEALTTRTEVTTAYAKQRKCDRISA